MKVIIEIPKNSFIKYELDTKTGQLICDRILQIPFPQNYGFIPNTKAQDGDELDVVLLLEQSLHPNTQIECKIIGYLEMEDEKGIDEKIIAVPLESKFNVISEIHKYMLDEIREFFIHYKDHDPNRWSKVGEFYGKDSAIKLYEKYKL